MAFEILGKLAVSFLGGFADRGKKRDDVQVPQLRPMDTQVTGTTTGVSNLRAASAAGDAGDVVPPLGSTNRIAALQERYEQFLSAINADEGAVKGTTSRTRIA